MTLLASKNTSTMAILRYIRNYLELRNMYMARTSINIILSSTVSLLVFSYLFINKHHNAWLIVQTQAHVHVTHKFSAACKIQDIRYCSSFMVNQEHIHAMHTSVSYIYTYIFMHKHRHKRITDDDIHPCTHSFL